MSYNEATRGQGNDINWTKPCSTKKTCFLLQRDSLQLHGREHYSGGSPIRLIEIYTEKAVMPKTEIIEVVCLTALRLGVRFKVADLHAT